MKKLLLFTILFFFPLLAHAQPSDNWLSRLDSTNIPTIETREVQVSNEIVESWKSNYRLGKSAGLRYETTLSDYVSDATGQKQATNKATGKQYSFDMGRIFDWIKTQSETINHEPVDAELEIKDGRAVKFAPDQPGLAVDVLNSTLKTVNNLESGRNTALLLIRKIQPKVTLAQTNNLGIKELVTEGSSTFAGSPANRRFNVKLGTSHINGVIVAPGEEFSFNKNVGEISEKTGYKEALVIKQDGTKPEAGGGMCQVSSTVFRAAMYGGMKITTRRNHAYAVQYYTPAGTDATTYNPTQDFKFINDTKGSLLIWAETPNKDTLIFKFYGTKDDRIVKVNKPISYDKKPDGSLKAEWSRSVTLDGKTRDDVFKSNYLSPDLFHKNQESGKVGPNGLLMSSDTSSTTSITTKPSTVGSSTAQ